MTIKNNRPHNQRIRNIIDIATCCDIILTRGKTPIEKTLQLILKNSHAMLYVAPGIIRHISHNVAREELLKKRISGRQVTIMRFKNITQEQKEIMLQASLFDTDKKMKYAHRAFGGFIAFQIIKFMNMDIIRRFSNPWKMIDREVCSTIIRKWARAAGLEIHLWLGKGQITPDDILRSEELEIIYKENNQC